MNPEESPTLGDSDLKVFLFVPASVLVYVLENANPNDKYIYNAESLEKLNYSIPRSEIVFSKIEGVVSSKFGVNPLVLGYQNNVLELVYAPPDSQFVYRSDGQPADSSQGAVMVRSSVSIPDIDQSVVSKSSPQLVRKELQTPSESSINRYIELSRNGVKQPISQSWQFERTIQTVPLVNHPNNPNLSPRQSPISVDMMRETHVESFIRTASPTESIPKIALTETTARVQELDTLKKDVETMKKDIVGFQQTIVGLQQTIVGLQQTIVGLKSQPVSVSNNSEVNDLKLVVEAFIQRVYGLQPLSPLTSRTVDGVSAKVIGDFEYNRFVSDGSIVKSYPSVLLQPYASDSYKTKSRVLVIHTKDGNVHLYIQKIH